MLKKKEYKFVLSFQLGKLVFWTTIVLYVNL